MSTWEMPPDKRTARLALGESFSLEVTHQSPTAWRAAFRAMANDGLWATVRTWPECAPTREQGIERAMDLLAQIRAELEVLP